MKKAFTVSITPAGTVRYPLHRHSQWEIMYYLSGSGYMATTDGNIPFQKGSIIIIPPQILHGSISENGFVNISVGGDFSHLFMFSHPIRLLDNELLEAKLLAGLIFHNRHGREEYLASLCNSYACFLLQKVESESSIKQCVREIIREIEKKYTDCHFTVAELLKKSGYAEDYIRAEFKKVTRATPVQLLTQMRIDHARNLLEIYGKSRTLTEIASACGFGDVVYFSKKFKKIFGVSPDEYRKGL